MALTSKQRAALRSAANTMDPVYQIGKGEIDDTLKQGIADCIAARELIKVKVLENSEYSARAARRAGGRSRICLRSRKRSLSVLTPKNPASRVSVSRSGEETPRSQLETD